MAQEGLFFTGTVLKNNRNLLKEEAARQQLAMQREQLELQKQAAADKRKEARKKNEYKPKNYTADGMLPFLSDNLVSKVSSYRKYLDENSQEYNDDPSTRSSVVDMEGELTGYTSRAKNISSTVTAYDNLVKQGQGGTLVMADDGRYLYEYNIDKIQEVTSGQDAISLEEALELYPIDAGTVINRTPYKNPINALYDTKGSNMTIITNADGSQYKTLGDISKESEDVVAGLTPDENGNWDNPDMEKLYLGKQGTIEVDDEGSKENMSYPAAFAFETRGIDIAGSTTFTDKLDPKNPDTYDPELANEYIQFIKDKSEEKAKRNYPNQRIKAKAEDKDAEAKKAQMEYNIDTYNDIRDAATVEELGYQVHNTKYTSAENSQNNKADIKISDIKGTTQGAAMKESMEDQLGTDDYTGMAPVIVLGVTLDGDGQVVARVKNVLGGVEAYVSWNKVASKQIYDAMRPEGKKLIDYKQPTVEFDPNNH